MEIALVVSIIGILTAIATPMFLSYYQGAQLTSAARQVATSLNSARQLAITQNASICVHISTTAMHFHQGSCAGAVWVGPGSDAAGNIPVPAGITITPPADPQLQFSYLGAASPAKTYTVRNTQAGTTVTVTVAASGRIAVGP